MRKGLFLALFLGLAIFFSSSTAQAVISLEFVPSSQTVTRGFPINVAVKISGLGDLTAPSLGTFDLTVNFDPTILSFRRVSYGDPILGDQLDLSGLGSPTVTTSGKGFVNLFEVSFDLPDDLNALQSGEFILAVLTFKAVADGNSPLSLTVNALGDAFGETLTADVGSGSVAVTETRMLTGDFPGGGPDIFKLKCTNPPGEICATIQAEDGTPDSVYGVTVNCTTLGASDATTVATTPGTIAKACAEGCGRALITFFCDASSPDCADAYDAEVSCPKGNRLLEFKQLQNH